MGNLSAARLIYNEGDLSEGKPQQEGALEPGESFVDKAIDNNGQDVMVEDAYSNATGDVEVIPMTKQFDVIPLVFGGLAGFYGYQKFKSKKYGWAYAAAIAAAGILVGGVASKGIYRIGK